MEHFREIILKSFVCSRKRYHLSFFSFSSFGGHFVQRSVTILAMLVGGYPRNISVKLFRNRAIGLQGDVVQSFIFYFSSSGCFV